MLPEPVPMRSLEEMDLATESRMRVQGPGWGSVFHGDKPGFGKTEDLLGMDGFDGHTAVWMCHSVNTTEPGTLKMLKMASFSDVDLTVLFKKVVTANFA